MGRKPIGDVAMSSAERVRLFRARHAVAKPAKVKAAKAAKPKGAKGAAKAAKKAKKKAA